MSEFERQGYADMKSADRVLLWMAKCVELSEFSDMLTAEDIELLVMVRKITKKETKK